MSFLEMSLMGSAMILCVLLLRKLTKGRLPSVFLSVMWLATLIRLILPIDITSSMSLLGMVKQAGQPVFVPAARPVIPGIYISPLIVIWLTGTAICALIFLRAGARQKRVLKEALPADRTAELEKALKDEHMAHTVPVYMSDRIATPLTYGIIKPKIVLPSQAKLGEKELRYIIAHECGHIRHHDAAKKLLMLFAVCLHWFNPLVWLMLKVYNLDMEVACDRQLLFRFGPISRAEYARTLVSLEEKKRFTGILTECFSQSPLEERIRTIMEGKKSSIAGVLSSCMVFAFVTVLFATSPGASSSPFTAGTVIVSAVPFVTENAKNANTSVQVWRNGDYTMISPVTESSAAGGAVPYQQAFRAVDAQIAGVTVNIMNGYYAASEYKPASAILPVTLYTVPYTVMQPVSLP